MRVEAVPVVGAGHGVPRPVGSLEVLEDDPRVGVAVGRVAPDVEVARPAAGPGPAGALEPRMLIRRVVDHQLGDDLQIALVSGAQEIAKVAQRAVRLVHVGVIRDVVAVVPQGRGIERQQPDRGDAQVLEVVELLGQPREVAHPITAAVVVGLYVELIDDRVFVPEGVAAHRLTRAARG